MHEGVGLGLRVMQMAASEWENESEKCEQEGKTDLYPAKANKAVLWWIRPDAAELGPRYQSAAVNTDLLGPLDIGAEDKLCKQHSSGLSWRLSG